MTKERLSEERIKVLGIGASEDVNALLAERALLVAEIVA